MNRILVWHDKQLSDSNEPFGPTYYLERAYAPQKMRVYARVAPSGAPLEVEIRDDGVSILANRAVSYTTLSREASVITYGTPTGTFQVGEIVTGGTSGARAELVSFSRGIMLVQHIGAASFSADETVTGATSGATLTVHSFARAGLKTTETQNEANNSTILAEGSNLNEMADDFLSAEPVLEEGSLITCYIKKGSGAQDITVQLELESLDEESEEAD